MARPLDDPERLRHMLESAEKAVRLAKARKQADLEKDDLLHYALTYLVMIVGEASSRITTETRDKHPELPWKQMAGMRHRLIHDYYEVRLDVLWTTVKDDLPPLIATLKGILEPQPVRKPTKRRR
jgi:uncharacterized protein with HEPN domain